MRMDILGEDAPRSFGSVLTQPAVPLRAAFVVFQHDGQHPLGQSGFAKRVFMHRF